LAKSLSFVTITISENRRPASNNSTSSASRKPISRSDFATILNQLPSHSHSVGSDGHQSRRSCAQPRMIQIASRVRQTRPNIVLFKIRELSANLLVRHSSCK
jgi:hypothetical protein